MEQHAASVAALYHGEAIAERILAALAAEGHDPARLGIDDLAAADELHTRGREATAALAARVEPHPGMEVVDVGCGIGGPARYLAATHGCRVTGLDLTASFCAAAARLSAAVGLAGQVRFTCASALAMPFADATFELAWTVQMQMNVAAKARLYAEIHRVLRRGGRLAFQDIVAGPGGPVHTPVPWAKAPEHSHLVDAATLRATVAAAGFRELAWHDLTAEYQAWSRERAARPRPAREPALGIHLVLGPDAWERRRNAARSLLEDRIGFVQGVFERC